MEEIDEYKNSHTRPRILQQVVEITDRLATGDANYVQTIVSAAGQANAACQNNAHLILKALWEATQAEKVGNDPKKLAHLGRQFFISAELKKAVISARPSTGLPVGREVDLGIAVELALGVRLGLTATPRAMGLPHTVEHVTRDHLASIERAVNAKIQDRDALIDYLANWTPLTDRLENTPDFAGTLDDKTSQEIDLFDDAGNAWEEARDALASDPGNPLKASAAREAELRYEAAGVDVQHARAAARLTLLREQIELLLETEPREAPASTVPPPH